MIGKQIIVAIIEVTFKKSKKFPARKENREGKELTSDGQPSSSTNPPFIPVISGVAPWFVVRIQTKHRVFAIKNSSFLLLRNFLSSYLISAFTCCFISDPGKNRPEAQMHEIHGANNVLWLSQLSREGPMRKAFLFTMQKNRDWW